MKIAVVGAGIAGLCCASLLHAKHDIVLFEAGSYLGGHTNTVEVHHEDRTIAVDTGFIVFNERNYPNFCGFLERLGVRSDPTTMSFSVRCDRTGLEYGGNNLLGVFAQPFNLLRPSFLRMVRDIARLGTTGKAVLAAADDTQTIADLCDSGRFSREFLDHYLIPMGAAIWSAPREAMMRFPARFFLRFFDNHGMLDLRQRPQWRVIAGGSQSYVRAMAAPFLSRCRLNCAVRSVRRDPDGGVHIESPAGPERFDRIIIATHSNQALALLSDLTPAERDILSAMPYQPNEAILHTDASVLPRRRRAWAGWNYRIEDRPDAPVAVTYNMSILQSLNTRTPLCVTLNGAASIDPAAILGRFQYHHPLYTIPGESARTRWAQISGVNNTHFCGAYWGNGFHEDGVNSALAVCRQLGVAP